MGHPARSATTISRIGSILGLVALATLAAPATATAERTPPGGARIPGCTITGTPGADVLVGGPGDDVICGLGGNDRIYGGGGDDVLRGGPGADRLQGGSGDDVLRGDGGADVLRGGSGNDDLYAGAGDDDAQGGGGNDTIRGGSGDDQLGGGPGRDTIRAVDGPDFHDVVGCGSGDRDRAFADPRDDVGKNCEFDSQNTAPHAVDDSVSTTEDTALSLPATGAGSPVANDTDAEGDPLTVVAVSGAGGGTVSLAGGTILFTPTPNLCGPAAGHFDYTVSDGHSSDVGRVSVAITCTPDDPTAAADLAMVPEDASATPLDVLANDHDPDGDPLVIASRTSPAHGTVTITGGGSGLTYAPDPNYCNAPPSTTPDTFTYSLTPGGSTATVTVLVLCADDAPVAVDDSATVAQDDPATAIDVLANDTDIDGGPKTITGTTDPAHGTVAVTGGGSGLTYRPDPSYCNDPPGTTPDTFTYTLNGGSVATVSVTVICPDSPPTAVDDAATVSEDSGATAVDVLANDTDTDGGPKTITATSDPANGTVVITGGGSGLTYAPDANYCNNPPGTTPDTFTYTLNGGSTATVNMTVTCVDDAPTAVGDAASVTEDAPATAVDVLANDTDLDGGPRSIASVTQPANGTVVVTGGGTGLTYAPAANYCNNPPGSTLDTFTYTLTPGGSTATVSVTVDCAADAPVVTTTSTSLGYTENDPAVAVDPALTVTDVDSTTITSATVQISGNFHSGEDLLALANAGSHAPIGASYNVGTGLLTLSGSATPAAYQAALRDVTYVNSSDAPSTATRTITFTATDDSALSGSDTRGITITAVDDSPVAVNDSAAVLEDATATSVGVLGNDTDPDGGPKTIGSVTQPANGTVVITGGGTGLTYQPNANYCNNPPGTTPDTFTYTLNGGSSATVTIAVTCVNDAPVDLGESQAATGNTRLEVAVTSGGSTNPTRTSTTGNLLDNASDVDDPHSALTVDTSTVSDPAHGTVSVNADGSYVYTPDAGYTGADSFTYQVTDGKDASAAHTVDLTVGNRVWYVRANAAPGGDGRSESPYDTLTAADTAADAAGDTIYVFRKTGDTGTVSDASVDLLDNQRLIGSAVDLTDGAAVLYAGTTALRPSLTGTSVSLASGNVVRGLSLAASGTPALVGGAGDISGTLDQLVVSGDAGGLALNGTGGTFEVSDLTVSTTGGTAVALTTAGTVVFAPASQISITAANGPSLVASGTGLGTSAFDSITTTASGSGGVSMTNTTGTTTFGDLNLTTTSGATGAFVLSNAGTVSVSGAGTAHVDATGGPAVDVTGTSGVTLPFDSVSSTDSAGDGINLAGLGTGTFSAAAGSVTNATGIDVDLDGGSGAVSYGGGISDTTGQLVRVQNTTGGTKDFNGAVSDASSGSGGGIALANNTGATIRFDGGVVVSTTGTTAFSATGGGTLAITGASNTLAASNASALNVTSTTIHGDGLTFRSIAANGAPTSGIVLSDTGATGGLTVTGTGVAPSGGTIAGSVGPGISLTNVGGGVGLDGVNVTGGHDDGMNANTVNGLSITDSTFTSNGDSYASNLEDRGLDWLNVTGTDAIVRTTVSGAQDSDAHIRNTSAGTATLTVSGSTFTNSLHNAGLRLRGEGPSTMNATVQNSTFSLNADAAFSMQTDSLNGAHQTLLFDSNDVSGGSANAVSARPQISINTDSGSVGKVTISNNHVKSAAGAEIIVNSGAAQTAGGSLDARVIGNTINDAQPGTLDPLTDSGSSIWGWAHGDGATRMEIRNNIVQNSGLRALELSHNDGNGTADFTVTGNSFGMPDVSPNTFEGIYLFSGGAGGDASNVCVDFKNNDADGIGQQGLPDIALDQFGTTQLRFAGSSNTTPAGLEAYLRTVNPASPNLTVDTYGLGPTPTGAASCTLTSGTP